LLSRLDLDWSAIFHGRLAPALQSMKSVVSSSGNWKYAVYLFLFCTLPLAFVPASILCLAGGLLFDTFTAVLLIWLGTVACAFCSFVLARTLLRHWIQQHLLDRLKTLKRLDEHAGKNGFLVCLISRFLPFPYVFPGYAAGLTKIRLRDFIGATALGMLPWSFFYAIFSQGLVEGSPKQLTIGLTILAVIFITASVARHRMFGKKSGGEKLKKENFKTKKRGRK
jgi:uncharacterized membrane protein YdjX (TVP38/TMEM64 family)